MNIATLANLWSAPRNKCVRDCCRINDALMSVVERLTDYKQYALPILGCVGLFAAPAEHSPLEGSRALQRLAAGPYHTISAPISVAGSAIRLGVDMHGVHIISLSPRLRLANRSGIWAALQNFKQRATARLSPLMHFRRYGRNQCCIALWRATRSMSTILFAE